MKGDLERMNIELCLSVARKGAFEWNKWVRENKVDADFSYVDFRDPQNSEISFAGFQFPNEVRFVGAIFGALPLDYLADPRDEKMPSPEGGADFRGAAFGSTVDFSGAYFFGDADFVDAEFDAEGSNKFRRLRINARFRHVTFCDYASFDRVQFNTNTSFEGAIFIGRADFENGYFGQSVNFSDATFLDRAHFEGTTFIRPVRFTDARFGGEVDF